MKLIIKYQAKVQHRDALEKALRSIISITRSAPGCAQCDLHPSLDNKLIFFFDQLWENENALKAYNQRKHMQEFHILIDGMVDSIDTCISEH